MIPWKDFFYFSLTERRGILGLIVLIVVIVALSFLISTPESTPHADETFDREYAAFLSSQIERKQEREAKYANRFRPRTITLAPFDPNTTDSVGFLNLGLPPWMVANILRYRQKGGVFRRVEEFKKVYGLSDEQYATLLPYIVIKETFSSKDTARLYARQAAGDSMQTFKYPAGTVINLNRADTTELKKIPGIGSAIARMIVGYRRALGGFYQIEQLAELHLKVDSLRPWLSVNSNETKRINLNKASIERLKAHPYFDFYQARVIVEYRKKRGKLKNLKPLEFYEEFTPKELEKIAPYTCFE